MEWTCPACTFDNREELRVCTLCGTARPRRFGLNGVTIEEVIRNGGFKKVVPLSPLPPRPRNGGTVPTKKLPNRCPCRVDPGFRLPLSGKLPSNDKTAPPREPTSVCFHSTKATPSTACNDTGDISCTRRKGIYTALHRTEANPLLPWACPQCTYLNVPAAVLCKMCDADKPSPRGPTARLSSENTLP